MEEIIDVSGSFWGPLKEGTYDYRIEDTPRKDSKGMYLWKLSYQWEGQPEAGEIRLFANQMGELLEVLGFKKVEAKKFKWDPDLAVGKFFKATAYKEPDKKDLSKSYVRLKDVQKSEKTDDISF